MRGSALDAAASGGLRPDRLRRLLGERGSKVRAEILASCPSTNDEVLARSRAVPDAALFAVATDHQTHGRGRRGAGWIGVPGASLAVSIAARSRIAPAALAALPLAIGVACAEALAEIGARDVRLKWPNDLFVEDGKLGGILVESRVEAGATRVVIGIGLNVLPAAVQALRESRAAACVADVLDGLPDATALLAALLAHVEGAIAAFEADGFAAYRARWSALDAWRDRPIVATFADGTNIEGVAAGVAEDGALLVRTPRGLDRVIAADVSLRRR